MVFYAHTVVNPRAVMVESLNTIITYRAMTASTSPYNLAFRTQDDGV